MLFIIVKQSGNSMKSMIKFCLLKMKIPRTTTKLHLHAKYLTITSDLSGNLNKVVKTLNIQMIQ
jgi:hypothetical protein